MYCENLRLVLIDVGKSGPETSQNISHNNDAAIASWCLESCLLAQFLM